MSENPDWLTPADFKVAVVIPCYKVARQLTGVINRIGPEVSVIYCVDDACPEGSGAAAVEIANRDQRVRVLRHPRNQGVGGAVTAGYAQALQDGADVVIKIDGDGQMAPEQIRELVGPILRGEADYVKGNRFFHLEDLRSMPLFRLLGNAGLSFLSKLSSGCWNLFDPTNGFTAIHSTAASLLPLQKLSKRYFFESDMLFRLNSIRAVVVDVPVKSIYADEQSNLSISRTLAVFPFLHLRNFAKRLFYNYLLRDFNLASVNLMVGSALITFGTIFGALRWIRGYEMNLVASPGTVMLAALPIVLGWQSLMSFINFDVSNIPRRPLQRMIRNPRVEKVDISP
jgi:dolichol-phosphate mannosyltransferase